MPVYAAEEVDKESTVQIDVEETIICQMDGMKKMKKILCGK